MADLIRRARSFHKVNTLDNFDGSVPADALYFPPGEPICGIFAELSGTTGTAGFVTTICTLEYFSGATWNGTQWAGGSWTSWWTGSLQALCISASNHLYNKRIADELDFPMVPPAASRKLIRAPAGHAKAGQMIVPNTHAAAEVAGETDARFRFEAPDVGTAANWYAMATITVAESG